MEMQKNDDEPTDQFSKTDEKITQQSGEVGCVQNFLYDKDFEYRRRQLKQNLYRYNLT
jgi:hypothetical protein